MAEWGGGRVREIAGTWPPRGAAQAGGFAPSGFAAWGAFAERLRAWVGAEAGAGRLLPWVPVAFGAGIALYFTAFREPALTAALAAAMAACIAAFLFRRSKFLRPPCWAPQLPRALPPRPGRPRASPTPCSRARSIRCSSRALSRHATSASAPTALYCA